MLPEAGRFHESSASSSPHPDRMRARARLRIEVRKRSFISDIVTTEVFFTTEIFIVGLSSVGQGTGTAWSTDYLWIFVNTMIQGPEADFRRGDLDRERQDRLDCVRSPPGLIQSVSLPKAQLTLASGQTIVRPSPFHGTMARLLSCPAVRNVL